MRAPVVRAMTAAACRMHVQPRRRAWLSAAVTVPGAVGYEIVGKLAELSQIDLAKIDSYERKNQNRTTILSRITSLRGREPWAGYEELTAAEVQAVISEGDEQRANRARSHERTHKNRAGVLQAAEREHNHA
jgi:hypothetical protein